MAPNQTAWLPLDFLRDFAADVFEATGVPPGDAAVCADVLSAADRHGIDTHGLNRLKPIYYDRIRAGVQHAVTEMEIVREGPTTAVVDGHHGMGQVIGHQSMSIAMDKARAYGLGMVVVRDSSHYGIAGYYARMATDSDMIGITGTNASPTVAPTFAVENMFGTNPLTFGVPTDEDFPFILDCATSIAQRGKIEVADRLRKPIPAGWVVDTRGHDVTDSALALAGLKSGTASLLPLGGVGEETGGHKGFGYATVVELLSSVLQSGPYLRMLTGMADGRLAPRRNGHFFIAIDISAFGDPQECKQTAGSILRELRTAAKAPGQDRIYTAWEKEHLTSLERENTGVPVNASVQAEMIVMRDELGLWRYRFAFE